MLLVGRYRDRIPVASVTGIFLVDTDRTMYPGVNWTSKKWVPGIPLGVKAAGAWGWRPTTLLVSNVKKSEALTSPDILGTSRQPVVGETFTFTFTLYDYWAVGNTWKSKFVTVIVYESLLLTWWKPWKPGINWKSMSLQQAHLKYFHKEKLIIWCSFDRAS